MDIFGIVQEPDILPPDPGHHFSSVATDILGVSGRLMLKALIDSENDAAVLADLAKVRMRSEIGQPAQALVDNFGEHHAFLCRLHLERNDHRTKVSMWLN